MTIATKNGVPIIKGGSIATGCGCCGGWYCYTESDLVRVDFTKLPEVFDSAWSSHVLRNYHPVTTSTTEQTLAGYRQTAFQQYNSSAVLRLVHPHVSSRVLPRSGFGAWDGSISIQDNNGYTYGESWRVSLFTQTLSTCLRRIELGSYTLPILVAQVFNTVPVEESEFLTSVVCDGPASLKTFRSWGVAGQPRDSTFSTMQWRPARFGSHRETFAFSHTASYGAGSRPYIDAAPGEQVSFAISGVRGGHLRTQITVSTDTYEWPESCIDGTPQGSVYKEIGTPYNEQMDGTWSANIVVRLS
jgi:hypothetical protein